MQDDTWRNPVTGSTVTCSVVDPFDCQKPVKTRGLCRTHYQWRRRNPVGPFPMPDVRDKGIPVVCVVLDPFDCREPAVGQGLCTTHYAWRRRNPGEPFPPHWSQRPPLPPCSAEGCEMPSAALGFCIPHYHRSRQWGDPLGGGSKAGEVLAHFYAHVDDVNDECWPWPYAVNDSGYATLTIDGEKRTAYREALLHRSGPPPVVGMQAAHGPCKPGLRQECWNPTHLSWKTAQGNADDKVRDGTNLFGGTHPRAILDDAKVVQILFQCQVEHRSRRSVAESFGVTISTIHNIVSGRSWRHIPRNLTG